MADQNATRSFESGIQIEEAFIELKMLIDSYRDLKPDGDALLFTLGRAIDRFEFSLQSHQKVLHEGVQGVYDV